MGLRASLVARGVPFCLPASLHLSSRLIFWGVSEGVYEGSHCLGLFGRAIKGGPRSERLRGRYTRLVWFFLS